MLTIRPGLTLPLHEIDLTAIRAQGAGGQNVNKVASAIHLRFDVQASSLPQRYKEALLVRRDSRITRDGVIVIKAQEGRTQEQNREAALDRLRSLIASAGRVQRKRIATRPTKASQRRRVDRKTQRGKTKALRRSVGMDD